MDLPKNKETMYRAMKEDLRGKPLAGRTARTLGVRVAGPRADISPDADGMVQPGTGGMSVAMNDLRKLPKFRLPQIFGGDGRDPVFAMEANSLPELLNLRPVNMPHALVEPRTSCQFLLYEQALHKTRPFWRKIHE